jgi:hypothetical protein
MVIYIFSIDKERNIKQSRNLIDVENYEESKMIFQASSIVKYLNVTDSDTYYISIYNEDDIINEVLIKSTFTDEVLAKLKPSIEDILIDKDSIRVSNGWNDLKMPISTIKNTNFDFKNFKPENKYRLIIKERFSGKIEVLNWETKNKAYEDKKNIEDKVKNFTFGRNYKSVVVEQLSKRYKFIYKNLNADYLEVLAQEDYLNSKIINKVDISMLNIIKKLDEIIKIDDVKDEFLNHILKNIRVHENFKYTEKNGWNNSELYVMETRIPVYDQSFLSLDEQSDLITRIFPSMILKQTKFISEDRFNAKLTKRNVEKYKYDKIHEVLNKCYHFGVIPNEKHFEIFESVLHFHKLKKVEESVTKKAVRLINRKYLNVKNDSKTKNKND